MLNALEILKLENLRRLNKSIISKYEKEHVLNPTSITSRIKLRKWELINKRDVEIK